MTQVTFDHLGAKVTINEILERVTEEQIYQRICPDFPKHAFSCPWRDDDNPSFGFYQSRKTGRWRWKDHGTGENGSWIDYIMQAYNCDLRSAINFVASAFNIIPDDIFRTAKIVKQSYVKTANAVKEAPKDLQVIGRRYNTRDLAYWSQWPITRNILAYYHTKVADQVFCDGELLWTYSLENPIYYYFFPLTKHFKAYRPLEGNKKRKWKSNCDNLHDIQGYHQCMIKEYPGRPLLIVPKMKDIMFFRAFGLNAMGPHGEGHFMEEDFLRHLRKYCGPILYLGDNDEPGLKHLKKQEETTGIPGLFIDPKWGAKDPTDLWLHNYRKCYDLLNIIHELFRTIGATGTASGTAALRLSGTGTQNQPGILEGI